MVKSDPPPGSLLTWTSPLCARTMALTTLKPRPRPGCDRLLSTAIETVPYLRDFLGGNADACVPKRNDRLMSFDTGADHDASTDPVVFNRVIQQVGDHLPHSDKVGGDVDIFTAVHRYLFFLAPQFLSREHAIALGVMWLLAMATSSTIGALVLVFPKILVGKRRADE